MIEKLCLIRASFYGNPSVETHGPIRWGGVEVEAFVMARRKQEDILVKKLKLEEGEELKARLADVKRKHDKELEEIRAVAAAEAEKTKQKIADEKAGKSAAVAAKAEAEKAKADAEKAKAEAEKEQARAEKTRAFREKAVATAQKAEKKEKKEKKDKKDKKDKSRSRSPVPVAQSSKGTA